MNYRKRIKTTKRLAEWYDKKYEEMGGVWATPVDEINIHLDVLEVPADNTLRLLDIGCGDGNFMVEANKRVNCSGVEISWYAYKQSRGKGLDTHLISAEDMPIFEDDEFDFVVSIGSLEHIVNIGKALNEIHRILKGRFMFYCPNETWRHFDQPNERTMTDEEWTKLFKKHGLKVTRKQRVGDNTRFIGVKQ